MSDIPSGPLPQIDGLIPALDVSLVKLAECHITADCRLDFGSSDNPGIHYCLHGDGRLTAAGHPPIDLTPHTLVILPPGLAFHLASESPGPAPAFVTKSSVTLLPDQIKRYKTGPGVPDLTVICGYFRPVYGAVIDIFATLARPIVEHFSPEDHLQASLVAALAELHGEEAGSHAMAVALLRPVLLALIRRSLASPALWAERFAPLSDPFVARAVSAMVARPGAAHNVESLAALAGLSRSTFMARFMRAFGFPPMTFLRDLRMRRAATLLAANRRSIERIAHEVGYTSKSSFLRAFHSAHGCYPAQYAAQCALDFRTPNPDPISRQTA